MDRAMDMTRAPSKYKTVTIPALVQMSWAMIACAALCAAQSAEFTPLGDLPGGIIQSFGNAVSSDGHTIVGISSTTQSPYNSHGFIWDLTNGMRDLGSPNAIACSATGAVVVGAIQLTANVQQAGRWTPQTGWQSLDDLSGGSVYGTAYAVSDDAAVVVGESSSARSYPDNEAFIWMNATGMLGLGAFAGAAVTKSSARGISGDGSIIVGGATSPNTTATQREAYRWTEALGFVSLGELSGGSFYSEALGVSEGGEYIVGYSSSGQSGDYLEAFWWAEQTGMIGIGDLPGGIFSSVANAVSADGQVVVGAGFGSTQSALIWRYGHQPEAIKDVLIAAGIQDIAGWTLFEARGLSADGTVIVGWGLSPDGYLEAWRAVIPRQPPCLADVTGDRLVDLSDLALLLSGFGARAPNAPYSLACDIDRNGTVDLGDLAAVLANFGLICP